MLSLYSLHSSYMMKIVYNIKENISKLYTYGYRVLSVCMCGCLCLCKMYIRNVKEKAVTQPGTLNFISLDSNENEHKNFSSKHNAIGDRRLVSLMIKLKQPKEKKKTKKEISML